MLLTDEDDLGGAAAQTGSLVHAGVAEFHKNMGNLAKRKKAAWDAIAAHAAEFPLAEETEVRLLLTPYMDDKRNIEAEIITLNGKLMVEHQLEFILPPHPLDTTEEPIHVWGTTDQIRNFAGVPKVCDYKSGKRTGWEMIHDHAIQIAAYCYGARQIGITNCQPGPIIRGMGYRTRQAAESTMFKEEFVPGVFWNAPFRWEDVEAILEGARLGIALVRMGHVNYGPGPHCTFCEFQGLAGCTRAFKESQK